MHESWNNELEWALARWRTELATSGALRQWQIEELEDHLVASFETALMETATAHQAWRLALERTGSPLAITEEFEKVESMGTQSKYAGIALTVGLLAFVLNSGPGGLGMYVHIPSMLFVCAIVIGGLIASFGPTRLLHAIQASLGGSTPLALEMVASYSEVLRRAYRLSWMSGAIGFIVGFIQMLQNLQDPSMLGQGVATCSLSLLYGALLAEVVFANARQWLENRLQLS